MAQPTISRSSSELAQLSSTLSDADRTALAQVPADELCAWLDAKAEEFKRHRTTVLAMRNALAPVSRLPTDTLIDLFALLTEQGWRSADSDEWRWMLSKSSRKEASTDRQRRDRHASKHRWRLQRHR